MTGSFHIKGFAHLQHSVFQVMMFVRESFPTFLCEDVHGLFRSLFSISISVQL